MIVDQFHKKTFKGLDFTKISKRIKFLKWKIYGKNKDILRRKTGKEIEERNGIKMEGLQRTERIHELHRKRKNIKSVTEQKGSKKGNNEEDTFGNKRRNIGSESEVTENQENGLRKEDRKRRRKGLKELVRKQKKKRRREEKSERELANEGINEEMEEKVETSELTYLYTKSVRKESEKSKRTILHWNGFAEKYEERIMEKIEGEKETVGMNRRMATRKVNDEIRRELSERYRKRLNEDIETARKARYVVLEIGTRQAGRIGVDTLRKANLDEIEKEIYGE